MQFPDGTVAVSAEAMLVDESRSLGNREGRVQAAGDFSISASQKTYKKNLLAALRWTGTSVDVQENGCDDQI